ncbi:ribonuclease domain-containing protein [Nocardia brasiliensis]|uniref:ribonuclease domain-containing protein n=1 Tax=Nocardia brasiliensis TaxID=37326 RepID=UPI003D9257F6
MPAAGTPIFTARKPAETWCSARGSRFCAYDWGGIDSEACRVHRCRAGGGPDLGARVVDGCATNGTAGAGTKGGGTWQNRDGTLPRTDAAGRTIAYREWDVNIKQPGHNRDAERIVTGSDHSAWYTGDHYATFTRMR